MATTRIAGMLSIGGACCAAERLLVTRLIGLSEIGVAVPKLYAGVILVNGVTSSFVVIGLGFMVGKARGACREKALKDGDADAEARFSYPKLYAEGFSEEAKNFNCVQRGHQQALETYTQFVALSLIGGIRHPVLVTAAGLLWCYARVKWAQGYATGDPGKRYTNSKLAWHIWTTLIFVAAAAASTGIQLLLA